MAFSATAKLQADLKNIVGWMQTGQLERASLLCAKVCRAYPDHADALHLQAIISAKTQHYEMANKYFDRAIASSPSRADFYGNYGNALLEQGRVDDTIQCCQQALSLDQSRFEVYNTLGNALYKTDKLSEAIICYRKALDLQPNYPEACNNLGQALKEQNNSIEAETFFRKALKLRPDFDKAAANLAEVNSSWLEPIQGKKICLRRACESDAPYLWQCSQDTEFMNLYNCFIPSNISVENLAAKLRAEEKIHPCQKKSITWIIYLETGQETTRPVGIANLVDIQLGHQKAEYLIGLPRITDRSSGIGLEATLLIMDFVFNTVKLNKLVAFVYSYNTVSQKNMLKIGFKQESFLHQHLWEPVRKKFVDVYGNGMTQSDFSKNARVEKLSKRILGRA